MLCNKSHFEEKGYLKNLSKRFQSVIFEEFNPGSVVQRDDPIS